MVVLASIKGPKSFSCLGVEDLDSLEHILSVELCERHCSYYEFQYAYSASEKKGLDEKKGV